MRRSRAKAEASCRIARSSEPGSTAISGGTSSSGAKTTPPGMSSWKARRASSTSTGTIAVSRCPLARPSSSPRPASSSASSPFAHSRSTICATRPPLTRCSQSASTRLAVGGSNQTTRSGPTHAAAPVLPSRRAVRSASCERRQRLRSSRVRVSIRSGAPEEMIRAEPTRTGVAQVAEPLQPLQREERGPGLAAPARRPSQLGERDRGEGGDDRNAGHPLALRCRPAGLRRPGRRGRGTRCRARFRTRPRQTPGSAREPGASARRRTRTGRRRASRHRGRSTRSRSPPRRPRRRRRAARRAARCAARSVFAGS